MTCGEAAPGVTSGEEEMKLPQAVGELLRTFGTSTTYLRLWTAVVEGRIPATRLGSQYRLRREHLPIAAEVLAAAPVRPPARRAAGGRAPREASEQAQAAA
jgi:hypothetical protein